MKKVIHCEMCGQLPEDLMEYVVCAEDFNLSPDEYVIQNEGTYNPHTGTFLCTDCYIKAGMPLRINTLISINDLIEVIAPKFVSPSLAVKLKEVGLMRNVFEVTYGDVFCSTEYTTFITPSGTIETGHQCRVIEEDAYDIPYLSLYQCWVPTLGDIINILSERGMTLDFNYDDVSNRWACGTSVTLIGDEPIFKSARSKADSAGEVLYEFLRRQELCKMCEAKDGK